MMLGLENLSLWQRLNSFCLILILSLIILHNKLKLHIFHFLNIFFIFLIYFSFFLNIFFIFFHPLKISNIWTTNAQKYHLYNFMNSVLYSRLRVLYLLSFNQLYCTHAICLVKSKHISFWKTVKPGSFSE